MEKKQKIILGSLISAVILLTVIFILILILKKPQNSNNPNGNEKVIKEISQPTTEEQNEMTNILNNARGFVEVYFSYSNSSDFSNAKEVYSFMTKSLKEKVDENILEMQNNNQNKDKYFLKTTSVLSAKINGEYTKNKAVVEISVVERNTDENYKETVVEKKYNVYMIKSDKWRINDIKLIVLNLEKSIFN